MGMIKDITNKLPAMHNEDIHLRLRFQRNTKQKLFPISCIKITKTKTSNKIKPPQKTTGKFQNPIPNRAQQNQITCNDKLFSLSRNS